MAGKTAPLKAAVIGVGIGKLHIEGYQKSGKAEVVAICDIDEVRGAAAAKEYGVEKFVNNVDALWDMDLDAVSVCVPNAAHADIAIEAMKRGIPTICEKPMANTLENARRIMETQHATGTPLMMAYNNRHRSESQAIRAAVERGDLGRVYYAKCGWVRRHGIPGMGGWFTTKSQSGGGPMMDIGVHALDMTLYMMGFPKVVSVTGVTYAEFGPRGRGMGDWAQPDDANVFDVEDLAAGFIRLENGAAVAVEASWAQFVPEDSLYSTLYGTEGGANVTPFGLYKDDAEGKVADEFPTLEEVEGHHAEVIHFVDCMLTGKTPIGTVDEGYAVMQILDALYRSAQTGAEVRL